MVHCYELDGSQMQDLEQAHIYLKMHLYLPDYYGMNLDALFDCLTELQEETFFWLNASDKIHPKLLHVLEKSAAENPFLTVISAN